MKYFNEKILIFLSSKHCLVYIQMNGGLLSVAPMGYSYCRTRNCLQNISGTSHLKKRKRGETKKNVTMTRCAPRNTPIAKVVQQETEKEIKVLNMI